MSNPKGIAERVVPYSLNGEKYSISVKIWAMAVGNSKRLYIHSFEIIKATDSNMKELNNKQMALLREDIESFHNSFVSSLYEALIRKLQ